jgi:ABC-type transport system involved in multi-copper enzyme maturation permease subunit
VFHKALWYQNYKQTRIIIWMILALFILHMPFQSVLSLERWNEQEQQAQQVEDYIYEIQAWDVLEIFSQGTLPILLSISIIALACLLIGLERNTRRNDFTFSLPFKRRDLFLAKWCYGVSVIGIFHVVNYFIAYFIIQQSEYQSALNLVSKIEIFWGPLLGFIMFFTFALVIGTISGEMISQIILTFIFGIFPIGVFFLIQELINVHFRIHINYPIWLEYLTPFMYVFNHPALLTTIIAPIIFTGLLIWLGVCLYKRNKIEHNGEFLIFKVLNPIFLIGITICLSLLGGMIVSSFAPWNADLLRIISYWIGFTTFLLFSLLIVNKLLSMNITFRGKA